MPFAFRNQPLKGLYLLYQLISTLFVRLPLWTIFFTPRILRPRPTWTLKRSLLVTFIRHFSSVSNQTGPFAVVPDHTAITPGEGGTGVWIEGTPELITGDIKTLAEIARVSSTRLPGYWTHKRGTDIQVAAPPLSGEKVVLNLHGGAYVRMSAHPSDPTANIVTGLLKHVAPVKRVFSLEYRLSSDKPFIVANPFPAALIDAIAGYNYLVNVVGFSPSDVVVCGDSAGANLAHALVRYLVENQASVEPKIPGPPGALILLSPWSDLSLYHDDIPGGSGLNFVNSDYVGARNGAIPYAKGAFTGPHGRGIAMTNPYISPASLHPGFTISFKNFPRTFIAGGGAEVLIDAIRTLKNRMVSDLGEGNGVDSGEGKVRYHEEPDACHDYLVFRWHEPERTNTLNAIAEWLGA